MRGIMVAIEGLDIVGKSTIARTLAEKDGWKYYKTPPSAYYEACVKSGRDGRPAFTEDIFRLFIECLKYSSREISSLLEAGDSVAVDRWLWTTLSYHFAFNPDLEAKWHKIEAKEVLTLAQPELSLLVHIADQTVYSRRKASRGVLTAHDKMVVKDKGASDKVFWNFQRLNPNFVLVDNSGDFKSTMEIVWSHIDSARAA